MATTIPENRARFGLEALAVATGGTVVQGAPDLEVVGVCTDSRRVAPGNLYVALQGERFDGHAFIDAAIEAGASAVLVSTDAGVPSGCACIRVEDTLRALGDLATDHRRRWGGRVVAITGSAGKTTTKELTHAGLRAAGVRATRSAGNLNNLIGVPMSLLCLDADSEVAVLELGTSAPGEIARLAEIAEPQVGVVTSVSLAHTALLGSLADVATEKAALLRAIPPDGTAIHNADDAALGAALGGVRAGQRLSFGMADGADVRLLDRSFDGTRSTCDFSVPGRADRLRVPLRLVGGGPAIDTGAALAVALAVVGAGALVAAAGGLADVEAPPGRLHPVDGPRGALVLDDSYNANPASMRASIQTAAELAKARAGRLLLVLGDMLELGEHAARAHAEVGEAAVHAGAAVLFTCGTDMRIAHDAAGASGATLDLSHCADSGDLVAAVTPLREGLGAGDVVLVKGSRGMAMERAVAALVGGEGGA